jgi:hypothetical protein
MSSKALFDVPAGAVALVSIIDSTLRISNMPLDYLMSPGMEGLDTMAPLTTWSFLVKSSTGKTALFDLGVPPDTDSYSPLIVKKLKTCGWHVEAKKHVADILKENGVDPTTIDSVIWR